MEDIKKYSYRDIFSIAGRSLHLAWRKEKKTLSILLFLNLVNASIFYLQLTSFSSIVDEIIRIKELSLGITETLIKNTILLGISFFIPAFFSNFASLYDTMFRNKFGTKLQLHLVDIYSSLDIATFEGSDFQTKRDRAQKWGTGSITNVVHWIIRILRGIVSFIIAGIILYKIHPLLVIVAIAGALPYYFIEQTYGRKIFGLTWVQTDDARIEQDKMGYFRDPKKMVEVILFNIKNLFKNQITEIANAYDKKLIAITKKESITTIAADVFQLMCLFFVIVFVTYQTLQGVFLVGILFLAFSTYRAFLLNTQTFFTDYARLVEQARFASYWFDIFDIKPRLVNTSNALKPVWEKPPVIEFKNVSFMYPDTDVVVLKNISFTLLSGEKLAIVGENGAGKTTLIKLLCRVYDPTEGEIFVDGVNLKNIDIQHWHNYLGVLFQDFTNYNLTVRESIAISKPDEPIDDKKVQESAEMVGADSFINELPKKYNQLIWKGFQDGVELSKGQHQRMAVARIFYRDALISILDEPTSAIDAVAEEKIFEVLEKKMEGKTVILISHRFSTVKNADQIAVIEHGELKELGSHKDLMAKKGRYAELYTMQASRYLESE